jgi:hypothetical protein
MVFCIPATGQTLDATQLREPTDLATTWLAQAGDDPRYAEPGFDDSKWIAVDGKKSFAAYFPNNRQHILWLRLRVKVFPNDRELALEAHSIAPAFEVYSNGALLMRKGQLSPLVPYTTAATMVERIPEAQVATGLVVIALRVYLPEWARNYSKWKVGGIDLGLFGTLLRLGHEPELREHILLAAIYKRGSTCVSRLLGLGLGVVALALFIAKPSQREYLWIFLQSVCGAVYAFILTLELCINIPARWEPLEGAAQFAELSFTALVYFAFLRLRIRWWMKAWLAAGWLTIVLALFSVNLSESVATYSLVGVGVGLGLLTLLTSVIIPILLILHLRRGNREAGILLIPAIASSVPFYVIIALAVMSAVPAFRAQEARLKGLLGSPNLVSFAFEDLGSFIFIGSLTIIIVLRSTRMSRQQAVFESELAAAREVQLVILADAVETIPGFRVESVYQPAQHVGGDFFQILPDRQGGLLLVVGDVAGKGLPAAMLVSVLVGAIRTAAEDSSDPGLMLSKLNNRLVGRSRGGFSTSLSAHIAADGLVTIANAGHLSPYLDGKEVELAGALPLGILGGTSYETSSFELAAGSRLTFYSDGVVEAQNQQGELFGFERGRVISTQPAAAIVEAAKKFGQSDDITVVAIQRLAAVIAA